MVVVGRKRLEEFAAGHADAKKTLDAWLAEVRDAKWQTPQDIRDRYSSASFLPDGWIIFNIRGNKYRLAVTVAFATGVVSIGWVGTHAEYDRWKP